MFNPPTPADPSPDKSSPSLRPLLCHRSGHMLLRKSQNPQRQGGGNMLYAAPLRISTNSSAISNFGKAFPRCSGGSGHPPHRCWGMGCSLPGKRNQNTIYDHLFPSSCPLKPQPCPPSPRSAPSSCCSLAGRHQCSKALPRGSSSTAAPQRSANPNPCAQLEAEMHGSGHQAGLGICRHHAPISATQSLPSL